MQNTNAEYIIEQLLQCYDEAYNITKTAKSNKKSLSGSNFYGNKFHKLIVKLTSLEVELNVLLQGYPEANQEEFANFQAAQSTIKLISATSQQKLAAKKIVELYFTSKLRPYISSIGTQTIPRTEPMLPMAVVQNTPEYYKRLVLQINGCYENGWYDACSVILRKFLESLIIAIYIKLNRANEIKKDSDFLGLEKLIDFISNDQTLNLGRESKRLFPEIKKIGDRAAHTRYYLSSKQDVDTVRPHFRVAAQELLHLAGY